MVVRDYQGRFPGTVEELRRLPGIGVYTAAAIAAIAFEQSATVVDGNVERVMARLFAVTDPLPAAKTRLAMLAATLTPSSRPGDYAQGTMDLGATICTPRNPRCILCPWQEPCLARRHGIAETLPAKLAKGVKPLRRGVAFWLQNPAGAVLLRQRPPRGLLGGMMEIPSTDWVTAMPDHQAASAIAPMAIQHWRRLPGEVRHSFTHFDLILDVLAARAGPDWASAEGRWVAVDCLNAEALPSLMMKVVKHALLHMA